MLENVQPDAAKPILGGTGLGHPPTAGRGSATFPALVWPLSVVGGGWKLGLRGPIPRLSLSRHSAEHSALPGLAARPTSSSNHRSHQ